MLSATITFAPSQRPQEFTFFARSGPWRFLADHAAIVLTPLCDRHACRVSDPPLFDRFEVWPVRWGLPDSLLTDHAGEVADLKCRFLAGEFDAAFEKRPTSASAREPRWEEWLESAGLHILWSRYADDAMRREWLNPTDSTSHAFGLGLLSRASNKPFVSAVISEDDLPRIRFRADFWLGDCGATLYLDACLETPLTPDEERTSPVFRAQEQAKLQAQRQIEARKAKTETLRAANLAAESKLTSQQQAHSKATKSHTEQQRDRQKRQAAGAATFQLVGHEEAAMQLIEYMREFRAKERKAGRKYGAVKAAIAAGRDWWRKKHTDPAAKAALNEDNASDSALRRWIEETPLRLKSRHREQ